MKVDRIFIVILNQYIKFTRAALVQRKLWVSGDSDNETLDHLVPDPEYNSDRQRAAVCGQFFRSAVGFNGHNAGP